MLKRVVIGVAVILCAWFAWVGATLPPRAGDTGSPAPVPGGPPVVRGAYHVHSNASDGTGTIAEIAAAAERAGLSFVILTDHGDAYREPAPPRYLGRVLVLDATEISTTDGHYTAVGLGRPPYPLAGEGRDVIEDVRRLGGFGVVAHPDSPRDALRWKEWEARADGIEWLNADSAWRELPTWRWLFALAHYAIRPVETVAACLRRPDAVMARWDRLAQQHPMVALAAADAHARFGFRKRPDPYNDRFYVRLPSYDVVFSAFSLNVETDHPLTGDPAADGLLLVSALRRGAVYSALDGLARPATLAFSAISASTSARQGGALAMNQAVLIRASANVPAGGSIVLFRNGELVDETRDSSLRYATNRPGVFRVEAWLPHDANSRPVPWILSNPIYVGMPAPAPDADAGVAGVAGPVQAFPEAAAWHVECDSSSSGSERTIDGGSGARVHELSFRLGSGPINPFAALVSKSSEPLKQATSLVFELSASRPMRVSVQLRLDHGESNVRWVRSIYAEPTPRTVRVVLTDMRVAGTGARIRFDPARVESVLFVIDSVNARSGDGGVVRIGKLQVETGPASGANRQ